MNQIQCTIVGFRHHAWRGLTLSSRIAQAQGRQVILMRDSENRRNSDAAVACIDSEVVAYVANDECQRIGSYIDSTQYGLLYGRITSVDAIDYRCTALIDVDTAIDEKPKVKNMGFEEWNSNWSHIPMARQTDEQLRQHMLQCHLLTQLSRKITDAAALYADIECYLDTMRYDISAEATDIRRAITQMLLHSDDNKLCLYGKRMEAAITAMGNNGVCTDIARYITRQYEQSGAVSEMVNRYATIGRDELEQALIAMPCSLHSEYRLSMADFVSRAYYLHIPQQVLRRFICAEILLDHTVNTTIRGGVEQDTLSAATEYISRINNYISTAWQDKATTLWNSIMEQYAMRITRLNGVKDISFNARFICQVIGRLIDLGVYSATVSQAEYGRTLSLNGKDMRSSINRALTDNPELRKAISQLVDRYK